jgi:undecaprenyl-diphosphatase
MNYFQAIILGVIQGITEFLPISSDGHLSIAQQLFGLTEVLSFDVFLHLGTLIAVIIFFWKDLWALKFKDWFLVGIGTLPAVFVGLWVKEWLEVLMHSAVYVGLFLILSGIFNFISHYFMSHPPENFNKVNWKRALVIGLFQASAIMPGLSRSGSTMMSGLLQKMDKQSTFKFSFFLAVPAILGAVILQGLDVAQSGLGNIAVGQYLVGGITAMITGLLSLRLLKFVVDKANFAFFGWYCVILGSALLIFQIL